MAGGGGPICATLRACSCGICDFLDGRGRMPREYWPLARSCSRRSAIARSSCVAWWTSATSASSDCQIPLRPAGAGKVELRSGAAGRTGFLGRTDGYLITQLGNPVLEEEGETVNRQTRVTSLDQEWTTEWRRTWIPQEERD